RAEVYVSASRSDSTSQSLLEAMAAGALPVVSDIPGNREWVTDGERANAGDRRGLVGLAQLFAPGDAQGLADAVERALGGAAWAGRARGAHARALHAR